MDSNTIKLLALVTILIPVIIVCASIGNLCINSVYNYEALNSANIKLDQENKILKQSNDELKQSYDELKQQCFQKPLNPTITPPTKTTPTTPIIIDEHSSNTIFNGVKQICEAATPSTLALTGSKLGWIIGDEDTISTPITSSTEINPLCIGIITTYGKGGIIGLSDSSFFNDEVINLFDNQQFGLNCFEFLNNNNGKRIIIPSNHDDFNYFGEKIQFLENLEEQGYSVTNSDDALTTSILSNYDILIIPTTWGDYSDSEISTITKFVSNGGGVLIEGLGWSYVEYNEGKTLDDFPINKIGNKFGIYWYDGYISDPTNNFNEKPIFHNFEP